MYQAVSQEYRPELQGGHGFPLTGSRGTTSPNKLPSGAFKRMSAL